MDPSIARVSKGYRVFCRVVCSGLALAGLFLIVFSIRTSQFTCQRSDGVCIISHLGLLAGPGHEILLDHIQRVYIFDAHSATDEHSLQLTVLGIDGASWPVNYSRVSFSSPLDSADQQINQFLKESSIPQVAVQLPDLRLNYLIIGIFFLFAGLIYTAANRRSFGKANLDFIEAQTLRQAVPFPDSSAEMLLAQQGKSFPKNNRFFRSSFRIWVTWILAPILLSTAGFFFINFIFGINFELAGWLLYFLIILIPSAAHAWVIHHTLGKGMRWLIHTSCGLVVLILLLLACYRLIHNFWGWVEVLSQGKLNPFGIGVGLVLGLFQWPVLRQRLSHASWWVLANAMAGLCSFSLFGLFIWVLALMGLKDLYLQSADFFLISLTVLLPIVYLGITGFVLIRLLKLRMT